VRDVSTRRVVLLVRSRQEGSKPLAARHLMPPTKENLALSNYSPTCFRRLMARKENCRAIEERKSEAAVADLRSIRNEFAALSHESTGQDPRNRNDITKSRSATERSLTVHGTSRFLDERHVEESEAGSVKISEASPVPGWQNVSASFD